MCSVVMAEEGELALAGSWKAKMVDALPSAPSIDKAHLDPGISPAAKAAVKPEFDDPEKRSWIGNFAISGR
jgi:hypothetical protein